MSLIAATILFFAIIALLIYVGTDMMPKWLSLRRHRMNEKALRQIDIMGEDDRTD